jgi:hypothetical protein
MENDAKGLPVAPIALGSATVFVAMAGIVVARETGLIEPGLSKRLVGLTIALVLILAGNFLPKLGLFRSFAGEPQARAAKAELAAGRILVLAGLVIMGVWAFAEISRAPLGAALIGLAAILLAFASWLWLKPGQDTNFAEPAAFEETAVSKQRNALRSTILHLLHGVAWAFVMFVADEIWGDQSIKWTVIAFIVSLGLVTTLEARGRLHR